MRRIGLTLVMLAAIPAAAIPLFACVLAMAAPAALIAGIAGLSTPSHAAHGLRPAANRIGPGGTGVDALVAMVPGGVARDGRDKNTTPARP